MITRIEIDGFKSFHNFAVDLRPFQVLIGPNGVGKSNLFDAIMLLSNLAKEETVAAAFRKSRGDVTELFSIQQDGSRSSRIRFAVEVLIDKQIQRSGSFFEIEDNHLRYELEIERDNEGRSGYLFVVDERLTSLVLPNMPPYLWVDSNRIVTIGQERWEGIIFKDFGRTILSTITSNVEHQLAFALRQEMLSWRFLQLDPVQLRKSSSLYAPDELAADGSNLPKVLYRMAQSDEFALIDVSRDMANLVSGLMKIEAKLLEGLDELLIQATNVDGSIFSSKVLSDGTLRLLALVALRNDPDHHSVLCLEEPENGITSATLEKFVGLLQSLAQVDNPLQQIFISTHSARMISYVQPDDLMFVYMPVHQPRQTRMMSLAVAEMDKGLRRFVLENMKRILDSSSETLAQKSLQNLVDTLWQT